MNSRGLNPCRQARSVQKTGTHPNRSGKRRPRARAHGKNIFGLKDQKPCQSATALDEIVRAAKGYPPPYSPQSLMMLPSCGTFFQVCRITQYSRGKRACPVGALVVGGGMRTRHIHIMLQFVAFKTIGKSKRCIFAKRIGNPDLYRQVCPWVKSSHVNMRVMQRMLPTDRSVAMTLEVGKGKHASLRRHEKVLRAAASSARQRFLSITKALRQHHNKSNSQCHPSGRPVLLFFTLTLRSTSSSFSVGTSSHVHAAEIAQPVQSFPYFCAVWPLRTYRPSPRRISRKNNIVPGFVLPPRQKPADENLVFLVYKITHINLICAIFSLDELGIPLRQRHSRNPRNNPVRRLLSSCITVREVIIVLFSSHPSGLPGAYYLRCQ